MLNFRWALIAALLLGLVLGSGFFQVETALAGCSPGEISDGIGGCLPCPAGNFCNGLTIQPCPPGTDSPGGAAFCSPAQGSTLNFIPDPDKDGVDFPLDNCPFVANPEQHDTWGGGEGNACDRNFYDSGDGVVIFRLKASGIYQVFSDCEGTTCTLITTFDPDDFAGLGEYPPDFLRYPAENGSRWFVDVYLLGQDADGNRVYQVNVYAPGGLLTDDGFVIFIAPDGSDFFVPHN